MSEKITLIIDGREVEAEAGEKILWVALRNGIYIPHLCAVHEDVSPVAACRLCFVEVEGYPKPVTACTEPAVEGMVVSTRSERVDRLVRTAFEMIMSVHRLDCKACPANRSCELQKIARERGLRLKPKRLPVLERALAVDESAPGFVYDPSKCVLCGRCVWACKQYGTGVLGFAYRGFERRVTTCGDVPIGEAGCNGCGACYSRCPVGALAKTR